MADDRPKIRCLRGWPSIDSGNGTSAKGLQKLPSDFGKLGGTPSNPQLLDWLAAEFVKRGFSMKAMHRLIVTSETYKLASAADAGADVGATRKVDPRHVSLAFPVAAARSRADLGFDFYRGGNIWICQSAGLRSTFGASNGRRGGGRRSATAGESIDPAGRLHGSRFFDQPGCQCRRSCRRSMSMMGVCRARCERRR